MRVLVTAGPTREPLDPVRFLSNRSSGRMGYEIARALLRSGHEVVLVSGPVRLRPPREARLVAVETAEEMLRACRRHWPRCQGLVGVAAVADFRPATRHPAKIKREETGPWTLDLVPNPDILATLAAEKDGRTVVGFALETAAAEGAGAAEALRKLRAKNLDYVVLNGPEVQGADRAVLRVFDATGREHRLGPARKRSLADALVRLAFPGDPDAGGGPDPQV